MDEANKRAKLLMRTPNPLYLSWLEEWMLKAREDNQPKRIRELTLATESLKKFPVQLNNAKECIILENFSRQLVDEIELREKQESPGATLSASSAEKLPNAKVETSTLVKMAVSILSPAKSSKRKPSSPTIASRRKKSSPSKSSSPFSPCKKPRPCTTTEQLIPSPFKPSHYNGPSPSEASGPTKCIASKATKSLSPSKKHNPQKSPTKASQAYSSDSQFSLPLAAWDDGSHRKQLSLVQDLVAPSKTTQKSRRKGTHSQDDFDKAVDAQQAVPLYETIIFPPGSFEVILLIDTAEKGFLSSVSESCDPVFSYEIRHLKVGDYAWIARGSAQKELLLPFLVERKRLDDLSKSVKDGRFSEQKFRLKMSSIPNIIYLIEDHSVRGNTQSLIQGISNMLIKDSFTVRETRDNLDSMRYLANMTRYLSMAMAGKTLVSSMEYDQDSGIQSDIVSLPEVGFFFAGMGKLRTFTSKEMFTKQLVQLHGLSADKAWAIVSKYQTPKALIEAFRVSGSSLLADLTCGLLNRKLGQTISSVLFKFYTSIDFD